MWYIPENRGEKKKKENYFLEIHDKTGPVTVINGEDNYYVEADIQTLFRLNLIIDDPFYL